LEILTLTLEAAPWLAANHLPNDAIRSSAVGVCDIELDDSVLFVGVIGSKTYIWYSTNIQDGKLRIEVKEEYLYGLLNHCKQKCRFTLL
jgi:hypothetical protein